MGGLSICNYMKEKEEIPKLRAVRPRLQKKNLIKWTVKKEYQIWGFTSLRNGNCYRMFNRTGQVNQRKKHKRERRGIP